MSSRRWLIRSLLAGDVDTLCAMLDYRGGSADVLDGNVVNEHVRWYAGTADDFKLFRVVLPASASTELPASPGPQIVLGIKGARAAPRHLALAPVAHGYSG